MINLSMVQALGIWSELEAAYYGKNGFGGTTAEIYAYRLQPCNPLLYSDLELSSKKVKGEAAIQAAKTMYQLLHHFNQEHNGCSIYVNGKHFGYWVARTPFEHRWHIRIEA